MYHTLRLKYVILRAAVTYSTKSNTGTGYVRLKYVILTTRCSTKSNTGYVRLKYVILQGVPYVGLTYGTGPWMGYVCAVFCITCAEIIFMMMQFRLYFD